MTVTEQLMKPGRFDLRLRPDAPYSVWSAVAELDHIVITPTRLVPLEAFSDANILAIAKAGGYCGVVTGKPDPTSFTGQGPGYWLGTDDGRGDLLDSAVSNTTGSLSTWVTSLRPSSVGSGTVTNTGTNLTYSFQWVTRREALDYVCAQVGAEWRVNADMTLDAAAPATLFTDYTTPGAMITRRPEGYDDGLTGIQAVALYPSRDVDSYITKAIVVAQQGDGAAVATGSATGSNVYKDFFNNNVTFERFVNAPDTPAANANTVASAVLALYSSVRRGIRLSSDTYAVPTRVRPGDKVWVYDPQSGLVDTANQVTWRGELVCPVKLRCKAYTWPIARGMGVYARRSGSTAVYTDLTDYVLWDTANTEWEVGTSVADPDQDPTQLGPAYLGVNGDILDRAAIGKRQTYTPAWSGTIGNGTLTGTYRIIGGWLDGEIELTWGSTTSHGAGTQTFGLPSGVTAAVTNGAPVGNARLIDSGTNYGRHAVTASTTTVALMAENGTFVSNTVPFTPGTGDQVFITYRCPI